MYYTLFRIPPELFGLPLFGPTGMATLLWLVVALAVTAFNARKQGLDSEVVSNAVLMIECPSGRLDELAISQILQTYQAKTYGRSGPVRKQIFAI